MSSSSSAAFAPRARRENRTAGRWRDRLVPIASHRRANTESALPAMSTSPPSAVGYAPDGATPGQRASAAATHHVADLEVGHRRFHQRGNRFVDRDVDLLPLPAALALTQRGKGSDHCEQRGERVAETDAAACRRPVGITGRVANAADGFADRTEARFAGPWTRLTEAGHVHDDHTGVRRARPCRSRDRTRRGVRGGSSRGSRRTSARSSARGRALRRCAGRRRPIACCARSTATTGRCLRA